MMRGYLQELQEKNFIREEKAKKGGKTYVLTEKGYEYLAEYQKVMQFVESFGLEEE